MSSSAHHDGTMMAPYMPSLCTYFAGLRGSSNTCAIAFLGSLDDGVELSAGPCVLHTHVSGRDEARSHQCGALRHGAEQQRAQASPHSSAPCKHEPQQFLCGMGLFVFAWPNANPVHDIIKPALQPALSLWRKGGDDSSRT